MNTSKRYSPEVWERAVRMVLEQKTEHSSQWATSEQARHRNMILQSNETNNLKAYSPPCPWLFDSGSR